MNKYLNPRSKRKQKARNKRELSEVVGSLKLSKITPYTHVGELTPDEFMVQDAKSKPLRVEPSIYRKEKPLKERGISARA